MGQTTAVAATKLITLSSGGSTGPSKEKDYLSDSMGVSELLVLVHAGLVQEWNIFLDSVFGRVVMHYLETDMGNVLPSQRFNLNRIKATNLPDMRESISDAAKEAFSFKSYKMRIESLRDIFGVDTSTLDAEMKKHVEIRNIFQHNRGVVRETDLVKIGQPNGGYFKLLDEKNNKKKYYRGNKISLSKPEVENLNEIVKKYSKEFEVLT